MLRIGWEFNGDFFPWSSASHPAAYAAYWRHIVRAMRKAKGQRFEFDWTAAIGTEASPPDLAYPGDGYVDYVGLDVFDQSFTPELAHGGRVTAVRVFADPGEARQLLPDPPLGS